MHSCACIRRGLIGAAAPHVLYITGRNSVLSHRVPRNPVAHILQYVVAYLIQYKSYAALGSVNEWHALCYSSDEKDRSERTSEFGYFPLSLSHR
jgi:hypothetical protein